MVQSRGQARRFLLFIQYKMAKTCSLRSQLQKLSPASPMGAPAEDSWHLLPLSLASQYCASHSSLSFLLVILSLSWLTATVLHWLFPGGAAWGRYWWTRGGKYAMIPGPRGYPIFGSMRLMRGLAHRHLDAVATRLGARRLMAFSLGGTRVIVTAHPNVAKEILNSSVFADRPIKESAYGLLFHRAIGFAPYGEYWRTLRRISSTHFFSPKQISMAAYKRESIALQMIEEFSRRTKEDGGNSVRVKDILKRASIGNIMWSVFGRSYDFGSSTEAEELRFLVEEGYDLLGKLNYSDHLPFLAFLDLQGIRRRSSELVPRVHRFVNKIISEHRKNNAPALTPDFVDVLLSLQAGKDGLSDSDMAVVLWEMVFRGADTVSVLIEWILARLVLHEGVQEKVHGELDLIVGPDRPVKESDISSLTYLNAVIMEAIRLHPPGPLLSWARLARSDTVVDGRFIPEGTTAMVNMWAITHDPHVWVQPEEFLPERFLQESESGVDFLSLFGSDLRLAPFGSGRRSCPGKALAMVTVSFWVASLLHEFDWLPESLEKRSIDLSEVLRLSCEMAVPLTVRLRRRRT